MENLKEEYEKLNEKYIELHKTCEKFSQQFNDLYTYFRFRMHEDDYKNIEDYITMIGKYQTDYVIVHKDHMSDLNDIPEDPINNDFWCGKILGPENDGHPDDEIPY